jgi:hypothetical protein
MRLPAYVDLVDYIDPAGDGTYLLALRVGQDYTVPFQFLQADGVTPEDMSGRSFKFVIGSNPQNVNMLTFTGNSQDRLGVRSQPSISSPIGTDGIVLISLAAATTAGFPIDTVKYTVLNTTNGANEAMIEGQIVMQLGLGA